VEPFLALIGYHWTTSVRRNERRDGMASTIIEVAKRAGVGVGTVSRVVNNKGYVDSETRARVEAAIVELDWVPREAARSLKSGRAQAVGVVVPFLTGPSISERLLGIESALVDAELDMIATSIERPGRRDAVLGRITQRGRIDGLLLVSIAPTTAELKHFDKVRLPVVVVDAHHRAAPRVIVDDAGGGYAVARHLLDLGHRRIGFIGDRPVPGFRFTSSRLRFGGVTKALREEGLGIPDNLVGLGAPTRADARGLATAMLVEDRPPTAIVAASDTQALGVLEAARELGIDVPAGLSVVGFDDIDAAEFAGLTTIRQPLAETGRRGVQRLVDLVEGRPIGQLREVLPVVLVPRRTTGQAPA
jgi:DNA-binding LacI/PurR family transcriptional regulator